MAIELVLLSDIALTPETMAEVASEVIPDGTGISYRDGEITQFVDSEGQSVLTVFDAMPVRFSSEAAAQLHDPPSVFALWTEIIIPFQNETQGQPLAAAFAGAVGGVLKEKR